MRGHPLHAMPPHADSCRATVMLCCHPTWQASSVKKINLADITRVETCSHHMELLMLLHTKSRVWQLLCDGNIEQLASAIQQNAKVRGAHDHCMHCGYSDTTSAWGFTTVSMSRLAAL